MNTRYFTSRFWDQSRMQAGVRVTVNDAMLDEVGGAEWYVDSEDANKVFEIEDQLNRWIAMGDNLDTMIGKSRALAIPVVRHSHVPRPV